MRKITFVTVAVLSALTYSSAITTKKVGTVASTSGFFNAAEVEVVKVDDLDDKVLSLISKNAELSSDA